MDTKPSTFYHTSEVQAFNKEARQNPSFGADDLTEANLLATARRDTGLDRFGDMGFLHALRMRLNALETEANLNPYGRMFARAHLLNSLKNRLWADACLEAHPEILRRKTAAPIIVVGQGRSGTTRLQRMLATDRRLQHLKAWEAFNPAPRMGLIDLGKAARRQEVAERLQKARRFNPGADRAHPMDADWADEEVFLIRHSFHDFHGFGVHVAPNYAKWFLQQDRTEAMVYMTDLMKLVSWSRGDPEDKPWVLKSPQNMLELDVVMRVFPDAKLVFIHRDPIKTTSSMFSLWWQFCVQNTDLPCRGPIKDIWMDCCEQMARRSIAARTNIPASQALDVQYGEMNSDWRAVMRRIYRFAGMDFDRETEQSMATWLVDSETENRHGDRSYRSEDYGTTDEEIDERMMFFRREYNIPYERKPLA